MSAVSQNVYMHSFATMCTVVFYLHTVFLHVSISQHTVLPHLHTYVTWHALYYQQYFVIIIGAQYHRTLFFQGLQISQNFAIFLHITKFISSDIRNSIMYRWSNSFAPGIHTKIRDYREIISEWGYKIFVCNCEIPSPN